jgi:hypothetical protein
MTHTAFDRVLAEPADRRAEFRVHGYVSVAGRPGGGPVGGPVGGPAGGAVSDEQNAHLRLSAAYLARTSADVVHKVVSRSGTAAIYRDHPLLADALVPQEHAFSARRCTTPPEPSS